MKLTDKEEKQFKKTKECYLCNQPFRFGDENKQWWPVRDHDHITGHYRGAAHSVCNINYHNRFTKIPVIFHNGGKYDTHLFITELAKHYPNMDVIPRTQENYITITAGKYQFMDSIAHMNSSLDDLVKNLKKSGNENFKIFGSKFQGDDFEMLLITVKTLRNLSHTLNDITTTLMAEEEISFLEKNIWFITTMLK
jgi:hypothetical protein